MLLTLIGALLLFQTQQNPPPTVAIDESFAARANLKVGDRVIVSSQPGADDFAVMTATRTGYTPIAAPETVVIAAIVRRGADPSEVADQFPPEANRVSLRSFLVAHKRAGRNSRACAR